MSFSSAISSSTPPLVRSLSAPILFRSAISSIAYAIDDAFANRIADSTNAGVMFAAANSSITRSSNAPSVGMQQMHGSDQIFKTGKSVAPSNVRIESSDYVMTGEPLAAGPHTGRRRDLHPLARPRARAVQGDREHAAHRRRRGAAPRIPLLVPDREARHASDRGARGVAQAVTGGDYSVNPNIESTDEVGILGRSFAKMITALREKSELEELYEQMAAKSAEREAVGVQRFVEPRARRGDGARHRSPRLGVGDGDPTR